MILYKGFNVGQIEHVHFNFMERMIYYNAFIRAPYHKLITTNTRFWSVSGLQAEATADGVTLQTGTLQALLQGGIAFSVPEGEHLGQPVTERAYYYIYPSQSAIYEKQYVFSLRYALLVDSKERGLSAGAPVYFRGIQVGKVLHSDNIEPGQNLLEHTMKIPVVLEIYPGSLGLEDSKQGKLEASEYINRLLTEGMNATIKVSNFLLGQQSVEINFPQPMLQQADPNPITFHNKLVVIPVIPDTISHITTQLGELVEKINNLPLQSLAWRLEQLLAKGEQTLSSIDQVAVDAHDRQLVTSFNGTMRNARELMQSYADNSTTSREIQRMLVTISDAFVELKPLLTQLKNKPTGLIFPSKPHNEPEPIRKPTEVRSLQ